MKIEESVLSQRRTRDQLLSQFSQFAVKRNGEEIPKTVAEFVGEDMGENVEDDLKVKKKQKLSLLVECKNLQANLYICVSCY